MGNGGLSHPISQWSKGEYADANNHEDDHAVIEAHGGDAIADDVGDTAATAAALSGALPVGATGEITTPADKDVFAFTPTPGSPTTISATPSASDSPDLDIELTVRDANGTVVATADPPSAVGPPGPPILIGGYYYTYPNTDLATGLDATVTLPPSAAGTYYAEVDGTGAGNPLLAGYTDYGSTGRYALTVSTAGGPTVATAALPATAVGVGYRAVLNAAGGTAPYTWNLVAGSLPAGLTLTSRGGISGVPTDPSDATFTVRVSDAVGSTANRVITIAASARPPAAPTQPVVAPLDASSVQLSWTPPLDTGRSPTSATPPVTGYVVTPYVGATAQPAMTFSTPDLTERIPGTPLAAYSFKVAAITAVGSGAQSEASAPFTIGTPAPPTAVVAVGGDASATISWTASTVPVGLDPTGYTVTATAPTGASTTVTFDSPATTRTVSGLTNTTPYTFRVATVNAAGTSAPSAPSNEATPQPGAVVSLASSANPSTYGEPTTLTATVTVPRAPTAIPSGTVTFTDGATPLGTATLVKGRARLSTNRIGAGDRTITATLGGSSALPATITERVTPASTTMTLTSSVSPSASGQSVVLKATVKALAPSNVSIDEGAVTFTVDGVQIGAGPVAVHSGIAALATRTLSVGPHTIEATYSGGPDVGAPAPVFLDQPVLPAATTTAVTTPTTPSPAPYGHKLIITAKVKITAPGSGVPSGQVRFILTDGDGNDAGAQTVTVVAGVARLTVIPEPGTLTITARYLGDDVGYLASSSEPITRLVVRASTTTSVTAKRTTTLAGTNVTMTATVKVIAPGSSYPGGTVAFFADGVLIAELAEVDGKAVLTTTLSHGAHTITAASGGDTRYLPSTATAPVTVNVT